MIKQLIPAMKLKAGISSSPCREASETEFLELTYRLMMTLLTGIFKFLKEGRRAGVFGVSAKDSSQK